MLDTPVSIGRLRPLTKLGSTISEHKPMSSWDVVLDATCLRLSAAMEPCPLNNNTVVYKVWCIGAVG